MSNVSLSPAKTSLKQQESSKVYVQQELSEVRRGLCTIRDQMTRSLNLRKKLQLLYWKWNLQLAFLFFKQWEGLKKGMLAGSWAEDTQALVVGIAYIIFKHSARRKAKKKMAGIVVAVLKGTLKEQEGVADCYKLDSCWLYERAFES